MLMASVTGISEILQNGSIEVNLHGESKEQILSELMNQLAGHPNVINLEEARNAVLAREHMMSTGVGHGLALPHAKTSSVKGIVAAFATTEQPIEYDAIDGLPVRMLFLMISTERSKSQHIKLLSRVSRLMNEEAFRSRLLEAQVPAEVLQIFQEGELGLT